MPAALTQKLQKHKIFLYKDIWSSYGEDFLMKKLCFASHLSKGAARLTWGCSFFVHKFHEKGGAASEGSSPADIMETLWWSSLFYDYLSLGALTTNANCALGRIDELAALEVVVFNRCVLIGSNS